MTDPNFLETFGGKVSPYPTTWKGHPILSRYGRAYWRGWHWFWEGNMLSKPQGYAFGRRYARYLHAFWSGYDMAKEAQLSGHKGP